MAFLGQLDLWMTFVLWLGRFENMLSSLMGQSPTALPHAKFQLDNLKHGETHSRTYIHTYLHTGLDILIVRVGYNKISDYASYQIIYLFCSKATLTTSGGLRHFG